MSKINRWVPAIILMIIIFLASGTPSTILPDYGVWDTFIKKGGHVLGYALLANSFWYGFGFQAEKAWKAWGLAVIYAMTDEYHQSFTSGRHPSLVDVFLFDGGGSLLGLSTAAAVFFYFARTSKKEVTE